MSGFVFACPVCGGGLVPEGQSRAVETGAVIAKSASADWTAAPTDQTQAAYRDAAPGDGPEALRCPADGHVYRCEGGIWRFLPPERLGHYEQFIREYETVRRAEGRVSPDPAYYRALPFRDLTGHNSGNWRIRAKSYEALLDRSVGPMERRLGRPLVVLDLGAGNGWLSYQLARRGHQVAGVDLVTNGFDGLGCYVHYDAAFTPVQAEFEHLPFPDGTVDLVIFNASFHYATDYAVTLTEALRVLRPGGVVAVVDSPVYRDGSSGAQMVRERESRFLKEYGFASNSVPSENYLTHDRLAQLEQQLGLRWERIEPFYGLGWAVRPWRARLRGHREPARFMVLVARRSERGSGGVGEWVTGARQDGQDRQDGPTDPVLVAGSLSHSPAPPLPHSLKRRVFYILTRLRYRLLERGRYDRLVMEEVGGKPILVLPEVFNPRLLRTGEILVQMLDSRLVPLGSSVLDMGTGSGVGAVFAATWAGKVTAVDLNPEAVRCARINSLLNRVEDRVEVVQGDLFGPVGERRFDVVLFNPPYYRGTPKSKLDMAWRSPDALERFAAELPMHLAPGGHALVVLSSDGEQAAFLEAARAAGLETGVAARRDLGNEVVTVHRLTAGAGGQGSGVSEWKA